MKKNEEFFVGYSNKTPPGTKRLVKRVVLSLFILLPLLGGLMAFLHKQYSTGRYEFGKLTLVEGFITRDPVPMLQIIGGPDQNGAQVIQSMPLVSFGKFGSKGLVDGYADRIKNETGKSLSEVIVTLEGTLAYNDGKAIFELTKKDKALISISAPPQGMVLKTFKPEIENIGEAVLKGEIIDPKCYFGAMNPGRGKSHRSCAIMCIRGGIPPMLAVKSTSGAMSYYILLSTNSGPINDKVLEYIADPVEVKGQLKSYGNWFLLLIDPKSGIQRL